METSIDTFLFHSVFKVIFVGALSNRYFGRYCRWNPCWISRISDGGEIESNHR